MSFAHLVDTKEAMTIFKARYVNAKDVHIEYYVKGDIENKRVPTINLSP